ncbi:hypothetical protein [Burkholderia sp. Ac-20379]|uniref:hypothetical protein n=1 Tax=Burkholderia sp. Ac-20379 TaxID=2703900 RepID=UPI001F11E687|nr:hypothetical protein [Burkholderia sp. Ac-20379]
MSLITFGLIKRKVSEFVARHGLTYKAYVLSILFLPPAALYIAWKRPNLPISGRVALGVVGVVAPPFIGAGTLLMVKVVVDFVRGTLVV